jgi:hypothetical protein
MTRAPKPLMADTVSADADPVIDYAANRSQSVIDYPRQQGDEGPCPLPSAGSSRGG